jgi:hypothetical protein
MRRVIAVACFSFLFVAMGNAQILPKGNVFIGYSYAHADVGGGNNVNLNGWNGSLEGKIFPYVGIVADLSGVYGGTDSPSICPVLITGTNCITVHTSIHQTNVLFGPRLSVSVGRFRPFAHALFGAAHESLSSNGSSNSDTSFADMFGGGIDYKVFHVAAWRLEGDYLGTRYFSGTQKDFRLSTGLVFNF